MADFIEREKILRKLRGDCLSHYPRYCIMGILSAANEVANIPAADVRPVVRGKWVRTGGKYSRHKTIDRRILTCSVCGNLLYMEGVNAGRGDANFCPNCGALMEDSKPPKEERDGEKVIPRR